MRIGIGLPNALPGRSGRNVVDWARQAEGTGYHSVASIDRIAFDNYDAVVALAAAAAVTERVDLLTAILLTPLRTTGLLAKSAVSLDQLSGGRFVLGVGVGNREDDYRASGAEAVFHRRGATLDHQLAQLHQIWRGEPWDAGTRLGPAPLTPGGPPVLLGGASPATWSRVAKYGAGWISGRGGPEDLATNATLVRKAWSEAGRDGEPRLLALVYFSLGPDAVVRAEGFIRGYYGYAPFVESMLTCTSVSAEMVQATARSFADAGCEELLLFPCSPEPAQVELLAEALAPTGYLSR
jgi:alkanesulfonate monooxygenase SsuD/methylene tetrahydromethanopterin reductase-like flavin-dependent oxidoreductase (luciferase family)